MSKLLQALAGGGKQTARFVEASKSLKSRLKTNFDDLTSLGTSGLEQAVKLPKGESKNEWLAVHVVDYINTINILYGSLSEHCTTNSCPKMTSGEYEYLWMNKNDKMYKKPVAVSAPKYVQLLMEWIESQLNDESVFPSDPKTPFPSNFTKIVKNIFKRLFRVYGHIYLHHFGHVKALGEDAHLNTNFKHFMYFVFEFELIDADDLKPLKETIIQLTGDAYKSKLK